MKTNSEDQLLLPAFRTFLFSPALLHGQTRNKLSFVVPNVAERETKRVRRRDVGVGRGLAALFSLQRCITLRSSLERNKKRERRCTDYLASGLQLLRVALLALGKNIACADLEHPTIEKKLARSEHCISSLTRSLSNTAH